MGETRLRVGEDNASTELELRRQNRYLTALQETALGLVGRLELDELLQTILARAGELFETRNGYVFLLDPESDEMVMRVGVGEYEHFVGSKARRGVALAGKVWEGGGPVLVEDYRTWGERLADPSRDVLHAVVGVPLKSRELVVGILGLAHLDPEKQFGPGEMDVLSRFAALASVALDNAQLHEAAQLAERYRDLLENANDLIQSIAADGHILYVNNAWKEALGYNDQEIRQMRFLDFVHPDGRADALEASAHLLHGEPLPELKLEYRTKDGRKLLVEGSATPRTVNGEVLSTRSILHEVTTRAAAEQQAAFQNALVNAQYQVSPDGILVVGSDDRLLSYNRRFVEMWRIPEDALKHGSGEALRQAVAENLADVEDWSRRSGEIYMRQSESSHDEITFKDGSMFERHSAPIRSAEGVYLGRVWFFHDVTESRVAEEGLRRVLEGTRAVFWRANVTKLADETQEAFGYHWETHYSNPEAVLAFLPIKIANGQDFGDAWYNSWLKDDRVQMDARSANALRNGLSGYTQEYRLRDANGNVHWLYEDAKIQSLDETRFEVIGFSSDITERKLAEETVRRQNDYMNALQETSLGLMQRLDVNSLLHDIVARAGALVGTENGYVYLMDADGEEMELRVGVGAYEGFVGRRTRRGVGLAGLVWETHAPVCVDDYREWEGRLADASRDILRAVIGVPMNSGDALIGVIGLAFLDEARKFGPEEVQALGRFAQLATIALDNARLNETAQQQLVERTRAQIALASQLRETELVNRVTSHAVSLDIDAALSQICRDLAEYFGVEQAGIALLSDDRASLTVVSEYSPPESPKVIGHVIPVHGNPSTEIVLNTREPAAFTDAQTDPRLATVHDLMRTRGTASILIAPLFVREEVIGTLGIDSYERREFSVGDISLVQRVALSISTALENARLYRAAQQELAERARAEQETLQRNNELEVISRISAVMTRDVDVVTALETMARELVSMFRARNCGIALLNHDRESLTVVADALSGEHEEHAVGIVIPVANNPSTQYVLEQRRALIIPDAQNDPMTAPIHERMRQRRTQCLAIVPLLSGGEVIGTIGLDTTDPNHIFTESEIRLAETMANQMASAIEKQRLFDQTRERARREQVTREIGAKLSRSLDMDTILQTMARELSHALGASHAVVRMGEHEKDSTRGN